jgi:hypothetical protein
VNWIFLYSASASRPAQRERKNADSLYKELAKIPVSLKEIHTFKPILKVSPQEVETLIFHPSCSLIMV